MVIDFLKYELKYVEEMVTEMFIFIILLSGAPTL